MLKLNYFLADIFILSAEKQPIKLSWRKIEWLHELVGRAETAVSELIKNAYDADARNVNVYFKNSNVIGGALEICDDGLGMDEGQLINGFMRISSSDKIHNPISPKYKRQRAGRKGIGRFATQRLGEELVIITQTANSDNALKITIDWNSYISDADLTSITFPIEVIPKLQKEGTILRINKLRDVWTIASIKRVYRYVIDFNTSVNFYRKIKS